MRSVSFLAFALAALVNTAAAAPKLGRRCTGTISSLSDVSAAQKCTTININGFTVPAGEGFTISAPSGATVNLLGDVLFGNKSWAGPLFTLSGTGITFQGNGHKFDGGGPFYWDGQGSNGGTTKPRPMMKIKMSGTFENVHVVNSPAQAFSLGNSAALTVSNVLVDNSQGDKPNSQSGGDPAGHNTDGFDVSTSDVTITGCTVKNQDDCLAINKGSNIAFTNNVCSGGHGISIGSITSGVTVSGVTISGNTVTNSQQAFRIKTDSAATGSTVSGVTYSGNTATNIKSYGVIIDESYPDTLGTPGSGTVISNINFITSTTSITLASSSADRVAVNCGSGGCTGTWNWSKLVTSGGKAGPITHATISGYSQ